MNLATIEEVRNVRPHPNADRLELVDVLNWQIIVRKGEFKQGDPCVLVVIDSLVPRAPWSEFLFKHPEETTFRLKTIKLRGEYSQGLVLPYDVLPYAMRFCGIGTDVTTVLGVTKYEKHIPACMGGEIAGDFPRHLAPRTDEDNALGRPKLVAEVLSHPCVITLKLDGSSGTYIYRDGALTHVCSRDCERREDDKGVYWQLARILQVNSGFSGIVQGEITGPGIEGNQLELVEPELHVFQVFEEDSSGIGRWLSYDEMRVFVDCVYSRYVKVVPFLGEVPAGVSLEYLQMVADNVTLPNGKPAEGIVVRPVVPRTYRGQGRPLGFKVMNRNYD